MNSWKAILGAAVFFGLITVYFAGGVSAGDEAAKTAESQSKTAGEQTETQRDKAAANKGESDSAAAEGSGSAELEGSGSHTHEGGHAGEKQEEGSH